MGFPRGVPSLTRHHLGPHPIIGHFLGRLNFRGIIRGCLGPALRQSLDHAEVLGVLVHNILISRGPMYRIHEWAEPIEPEAIGLTTAQVGCLNDDRFVRSLEALASERGRNVFFRLALRAIKDFEISVRRVHFDTTTVTFFGQYESSHTDPRITRGINKDHRPDLKQLLFGLNVSSDGAVPLHHHIFSGNRTDDSVHVRNLDELRALLGAEDFIYVADSKLCTKKNIEHVTAYGGHFVTVMPRTRKEDQLFRAELRKGGVRWRKFHESPNHRREDDPPDVYATTAAGPKWSEEGYRIIWVRSSQKADLDRQAREGRIRKAEVELHEISLKVGSRNLASPKNVKTRVRKILQAHRVREFIDVRVVAYDEFAVRYLRRGRPRPDDPVRKVRNRKLRIAVSRNKQAIRQEARTDGVFPLLTDLTQRSKRAILQFYKYQPYLERRFALFKSEYGVAPIFLKKPVRVAGLIHLYFIAMMVSALIERQVRLAMRARGIQKLPILPEGRPTKTPTTPRVLENFAQVTWYEFQEADRVVSFPIELSKTQRLLLDLMEVPRTLYR